MGSACRLPVTRGGSKIWCHGHEGDAQVFTDEGGGGIDRASVAAARVAWNAGADFVDTSISPRLRADEFSAPYTRLGRLWWGGLREPGRGGVASKGSWKAIPAWAARETRSTLA